MTAPETTLGNFFPRLDTQVWEQKNNMLLIDTSSSLLFLGRANVAPNSHISDWQLTSFSLQKKPHRLDSWLKEGLSDFYGHNFSSPPELIALGQGPGSFTSLRCGFTFVTILAGLWQIPCLNFSSYKLLEQLACPYFAQAKFLLRANRYLYFGYLPALKKVVAYSAEEWQKKYNSFSFFDYEDEKILREDFSSFHLIPSAQDHTTFSSAMRKNILRDIFIYPPHEQEVFPFAPQYGLDITFKKKENS